MSPSRVDQNDDPVTAEYTIYLTPQQQSQLLLLQYPNRERSRPYNARAANRPEEFRIKPKSGHVEIDAKLNTAHNFNRYQGLKWGDAIRSGRQVQNTTGTYGLAAGLAPGRGPRPARKDDVEREMEVQDDLMRFEEAEADGKVMRVQTLGGQIVDCERRGGKASPAYFIGAFRGDELHLSQVSGTVQMRPQFHHVDAEEQRARMAVARDYAASGALEGPEGSSAAGSRRADMPRQLQTTYKPLTTNNPRGEIEAREEELRKNLHNAAEEKWVQLEYIDEDDDEAYEEWNSRMFASEDGMGVALKSSMSADEYVDAISAPGREGMGKKRKRVKKGSAGDDPGEAEGG